MLLAITADLHLPCGRAGRPARGERERLVLGTWREALDLANKAGADAVVVAGDVFDTPYPSPWQVGDLATATGIEAGCPVYLMAGNHDVADEIHHALMAYPYYGESAGIGHMGGAGELRYIGLGKYTLAEGVCEVLSVPYAPHSAGGGRWLGDRLESLRLGVGHSDAPKTKILISHLGIAADDSPAYMREGRDVISASELLAIQRLYGISTSFLGNWHGERDFLDDPEHRAYQIGALCPTGYDNPGPQGSYGRILLYDTVTREVRAIRARHPTYQTLAAEEGVALLTERILIAQVPSDEGAVPDHVVDHYRVRVRSEEERSAVLAIAAAIEKDTALSRMVRVASVWAAEIAEEARDRSTSAAEVVRSAGALTLEQRIERYVAAKGVREGIDPAQVVEIACAHARGRT